MSESTFQESILGVALDHDHAYWRRELHTCPDDAIISKVCGNNSPGGVNVLKLCIEILMLEAAEEGVRTGRPDAARWTRLERFAVAASAEADRVVSSLPYVTPGTLLGSAREPTIQSEYSMCRFARALRGLTDDSKRLALFKRIAEKQSRQSWYPLRLGQVIVLM